MNKSLKTILRKNEFWLLCIVLIFSLAAGAANSAFWSKANLYNLLKSSVVMGVFAIGTMLVIISGGIDISFPAFAVFSYYITTKYLLYIKFSGSVFVPFLIASSIGLSLGLLNAFLISTFRLFPLIVTLGTGSAATGFLRAFIGTGTLSNLPQPMIDFSRWNILTDTLQDGSTIGFSGSFLIFIGIALISAFMLRKTTLGRGIYAMGGDMTAAVRAGFNVKKICYFTYGMAGIFAGIAGIIHCSLIRLANPRDLEGAEMEVIAAVVLGGASLTGGKGSVLGTVMGIFLIVLIKGSLIIMGIPTDRQKVAIGLVLIFATAITSYRAKRGVASR
jgi:simple sugar transport system permease protein